jgi:hypothetical protein
MIWTGNTADLCPARALRRHLACELTALHPRREDARGAMEEVAAAVTAACAPDASRATFPSSLFWLLASQACWRVGEREAAERFLQAFAERPQYRMPLRILLREGCLTLPTASALSIDLLSVRESDLTPSAPVWRLDLDRLCEPSQWVLGSLMEPQVRLALERLAVLWDPTGGRGVLILRGAPGRPARAWTAFAADLFERIADDRGWALRPGVILEIGASAPPAD